MLCGKYLGVASKETAKALACEGRSEKKQDPLDLAKAADGSTNRLQAMKAAFKVGMVLPLCNSSALWCLLEFSGLFDWREGRELFVFKNFLMNVFGCWQYAAGDFLF